MGFIAAMDSRILGENGAPELTAKGVGEPLVALFFKLVRGMPEATLRELMAACTKAGSASSYADLVVLCFQTRATRGMGKGLRRGIAARGSQQVGRSGWAMAGGSQRVGQSGWVLVAYHIPRVSG